MVSRQDYLQNNPFFAGGDVFAKVLKCTINVRKPLEICDVSGGGADIFPDDIIANADYFLVGIKYLVS
jgi:hypothetical protein